jgi:hypothetical protein
MVRYKCCKLKNVNSFAPTYMMKLSHLVNSLVHGHEIKPLAAHMQSTLSIREGVIWPDAKITCTIYKQLLLVNKIFAKGWPAGGAAETASKNANARARRVWWRCSQSVSRQSG